MALAKMKTNGRHENGALTVEPTPITVKIKAPDIRLLTIALVGTAPYVQNRFSNKAEMMKTQEAGQRAGNRKNRAPKDFNKLYEAAKHVSHEGWIGMPAPAFRSAMISACRLVGFHMTMAKLSIFVVADGYDKEDGTPLVRIVGEPIRHDAPVRNDNESADVRARPMWPEWSCTLRVNYDADQFSDQDVTNLIMRAGMQVGIGEGRPDSKTSNGMGWGTFAIANGKVKTKAVA